MSASALYFHDAPSRTYSSRNICWWMELVLGCEKTRFEKTGKSSLQYSSVGCRNGHLYPFTHGSIGRKLLLSAVGCSNSEFLRQELGEMTHLLWHFFVV